MLRLILVVAIFGCCGSALASEVGSCEERNVTLNQVQAMRQYANGSVKLFAIDQVEPAAAPVGIAVAIDRGEDLSELESFCRYVSGLSSAELRDASAVFDQARGVAMVYISHRMAEIFAHCDRITVLRDGKYICTEEVSKTEPQEIVRRMVGRLRGSGTRSRN